MKMGVMILHTGAFLRGADHDQAGLVIKKRLPGNAGKPLRRGLKK
jgi:hypothetical protein